MHSRDPDAGVNNIGIYRLMVKDRNSFGIQISETAHGNYIWKTYEKRGLPCPLAVILGGLSLKEADTRSRLLWAFVLAAGVVVIVLAR